MTYKNDPKWLLARFNGKCRKCNKPVKKGDSIFYYPSTKSVYCKECGNQESASFECMKQDEDFYNSRYY